MLAKRIIPCLDVKHGRVTKGVRFLDNHDVGDPVEMAHHYAAAGADELIFYDIGASPEKTSILLDWVGRVAAEINIPFCVGGGIRSVDDMRAVLLSGAEKVSLNTAAVKNPQLISEGARAFGSQCVVLGVDVRQLKAESQKLKTKSGYEVVIDGGRVGTGLDALAWCQEAVVLGVGEICLNSIDQDGVRSGYDLPLVELIASHVSVPVIASGGAGSAQDVVAVFQNTQAEAALLASVLHFGQETVVGIKQAMAAAGIAVRLDASMGETV